MNRPRLTKEEYDVVKRYRDRKSVVLVIPDLHSPFIKLGFLDFCKDVSYKYGATQIGIFKLYRTLKTLNLNTKEKRYRYFRSV